MLQHFFWALQMPTSNRAGPPRPLSTTKGDEGSGMRRGDDERQAS